MCFSPWFFSCPRLAIVKTNKDGWHLRSSFRGSVPFLGQNQWTGTGTEILQAHLFDYWFFQQFRLLILQMLCIKLVFLVAIKKMIFIVQTWETVLTNYPLISLVSKNFRRKNEIFSKVQSLFWMLYQRKFA